MKAYMEWRESEHDVDDNDDGVITWVQQAYNRTNKHC